MLYRQRTPASAQLLLFLIALGIVVGAGFFVYDNIRSSSPAVAPTVAAALPTQTITRPPPTTAPQITATADPYRPQADAEIFIPSAGIYAPVITAIIRGGTWDVDNLGLNVGYLEGTAWVGRPGNIVLSGHVEMSDGRTGVFASLTDVEIGDEVMITQRGTEYKYIVREVKSVEPNDLSVVMPQDSDVLTLITCGNYNFIRDVYETRLVVIADPVANS
ncbi:MAG: sortase [Chloroflexota bacterium]